MIKQKQLIKKSFTYVFDESIDQIYKCFLHLKLLMKIRPPEHPYSIIEIKNESVNLMYYVRWEEPSPFELTMQFMKTEEEDTYKILTKQIIAINRKKIDDPLIMKYKFYANTSNNSTIMIHSIRCSEKSKIFFDEFMNSFASKIIFNVCKKLHSLLKHKNALYQEVETILINRPLYQTFRYMSNIKHLLEITFPNVKEIHLITKGEKGDIMNKEFFIRKEKQIIKYRIDKIIRQKRRIAISISRDINGKNAELSKINLYLIEISPITTFVCLENEVPLHIDGYFLMALSQINIIILKQYKKILESLPSILELTG